MTREGAKALLPLIIAFSEGKTIQEVSGRGNGVWLDLREPNFCDDPSHYRIKPEPRDVWAVYNSQGVIVTSHPSEELAREWVKLRLCEKIYTIVHFKEVL